MKFTRPGLSPASGWMGGIRWKLGTYITDVVKIRQGRNFLRKLNWRLGK